MACPSDSLFDSFVADQLPSTLEHLMAEHLQICEACRQRAEELYGGEELRAAKLENRSHASHNGEVTLAEPEDLREDLYALIASDSEPPFPASEQAAELLRLLAAEPTDDVAGTRLGRFTVRRWLGAGGFGVVFLAYDELLHREVALKLPLAQALARREVRERFLREAEAAAQLHHPNVVPVFEAGEEQGICYIASGYCSGSTLDAWMGEQTEPAAVATAVALVRQLAEAVQHAHDHRVLHRDIKPSNILLNPNLANPLALTPLITDFGLAKLLDVDPGLTGSQGMMGTPRYMAPEQAAGKRGVIGPATDIFALGAVLYELLTDVAPYAGEDQAQTLHRLFHDRVVPPRRLRREVPRDLEAICLKCLERRPEDRYGSAQELADDLRRLEEGRTTHARPLGRLEKLRRWMIRQPAIAALLIVSGGGLLSVLAVLMVHSRSLKSFNVEMRAALDETRRAQAEIEGQDARLQNLLHISKIQLAHRAVEDNDLRQASRLLRDLRVEAPGVARGFVWRYLWNRVAAQGREIEDCDAEVYDLQFSPSGDRLAACGADGVVRIYHGESFAPLATVATDQGELNAVAFSPDERLIATAGDDGTVRLWDARTGAPHRTIQAHEEFAYGAVFTADGATLVTCGREPVIRLWDVHTGASRGSLAGHTGAVESVALSPDGVHLASGSSDQTARIWDLERGQPLLVLEGHAERVIDAQYSPRGNYLLTGSIDHTIRLWRTSDGQCLQIENHLDAIASVAFLKDGRRMLAADRGGSVLVWQSRTAGGATADGKAAPLHSWKAHEGRAWDVIVTPDEKEVLTAGADGKIYHWEQPPASQELIAVAEPGDQIRDVLFDRRPDRMHFIHSRQGMETWDVVRGQRTAQVELSAFNHRQPVALGLLPEQVMLVAFADDTIEAVELPSQERCFRLVTPWKGGESNVITDLAVSDDGRRLAVFSYHHDATLVYDAADLALLGTFNAYAQAMAISATGERLAMSDGDDVVVWDVDRRKRIALLQGHASSVGALSFSPDGRWLASGSKDRQVRLWDLDGETPPITLEGHRAAVGAVTFSPDGRLLASGDERGELKLWFLAESTELITIKDSEPIERLVFSPDSNRLAQQSLRQIRILNATRSRFGGSRSDSR